MNGLAYDAWVTRRLMEGFRHEPGELARVSAPLREAVRELAETPHEDRGAAFGTFAASLPNHDDFVRAMAAADPDGPPPGDEPEPEPDAWDWLAVARPPEPEADDCFDLAPADGPPDSSPCDVAAWLLAAGFRPVPTRGKNPGCVGGDWGSRAYAPATFRDVFASSRADGLGVMLGPGTGPDGAWLADLECDGPEGAESLRKLFKGDPPPTLGWESARGPHRLYVVDQGFVDALAPLAGKTSGSGTYHFDRLPGLEIRVGGTKPDGSPKALQSVCPPSVGSDGKPRRWTGPPTVATLPEAVSARLRRAAAKATADRPTQAPEPVPQASTGLAATAGDSTAAYAKAAMERECEAVATTPEGGRNHQLNTSAYKLGSLVASGALDESEARAGLEAAGGACGLADHEAAATIRSGMTAGKASPRDLSSVGTSRPTVGPKPPSPPPAESWGVPEPIKAELPPVQPLAADMTPAPLRAWLADIAGRVQCPADYPAAAALIGLAIAAGRRVMVRPMAHDDWTACANLWGCLVGRPSMLKTPALVAALKPLRRLEAEAREEHAKALAAYQGEMLVAAAEAGARKKELEAAARKGAPREQLLALAAAATAAVDRPEPPRRRYTTTDATVEKVGELLRDNPDGIGLVRDELAGWLKKLDKPGQEGDREFWLESWNGTGLSFTFDRIGRGTIDISNPTASVIGTTQPAKLALLIRETARDGGDGLLQRLQVAVYPDDPGPWRKVDRWPDSVARDRAFAVFKAMSGLTADAAGAETDRFDGTRFLRFAPDAQEVFYQWRAELSDRCRAPDVSPALESHLAKYPSLMPSVALLSHLCDVADGGTPGPVPLRAATLAVRWCDYLASHAERIYGIGDASDVVAAGALAKRIAAGDLPSPFTYRDVYHRDWSGLSKAEDVRRAVAALASRGWVRVVRNETTGGAPREDVHVNPRVRPQPPEENP